MKAFARSNKNDSPSFSLFLTNGIIQVFLIVILFNESTYQVFYTMSTTMIMIPYFLSALYYEKVSRKRLGFENSSAREFILARIFAIVGSIYGIWMLYSSGVEQLLITSILYAPGIIIYALGKREKQAKVFGRTYEVVIAAALVALAVLSLVFLATGRINPF